MTRRGAVVTIRRTHHEDKPAAATQRSASTAEGRYLRYGAEYGAGIDAHQVDDIADVVATARRQAHGLAEHGGTQRPLVHHDNTQHKAQ